MRQCYSINCVSSNNLIDTEIESTNKDDELSGDPASNDAPSQRSDGSSLEPDEKVEPINYVNIHHEMNNKLVIAEGNEKIKSACGRVGLKNLGNTCYMNSSLQCLSNTIPLTDYFVGFDFESELNPTNVLGSDNGNLARTYAALLKKIWFQSKERNGKNPVVDPSPFKKCLQDFAPNFKGRKQHDGQEFLSFLLDGLHEDLNRVHTKPYVEEKDSDGSDEDAVRVWEQYLMRDKSVIVDLFQGQIRSTLTCKNSSLKIDEKEEVNVDDSTERKPDEKNCIVEKEVDVDVTEGKEPSHRGCGNVSYKFEPFMFLSIPISTDTHTLDDCMELYCREEILEGEDKWYCSKCKEHVEATKKIDIWMLPPILIIHLKRFKYSSKGIRSKIGKPIQFPIKNWDVASFHTKRSHEKLKESSLRRNSRKQQNLPTVRKNGEIKIDLTSSVIKEEITEEMSQQYDSAASINGVKQNDGNSEKTLDPEQLKKSNENDSDRQKVQEDCNGSHVEHESDMCNYYQKQGQGYHSKSFGGYDLYAISNHYGNLSGGHYTANGLNRLDNKWYDFNDSSCHEVADIEKNLENLEKSAYCLFYNRMEDVSNNNKFEGRQYKEELPNDDQKQEIVEMKRMPIVRMQSISRPDLWPHNNKSIVAMEENGNIHKIESFLKAVSFGLAQSN